MKQADIKAIYHDVRFSLANLLEFKNDDVELMQMPELSISIRLSGKYNNSDADNFELCISQYDRKFKPSFEYIYCKGGSGFSLQDLVKITRLFNEWQGDL